SLLRRIVLVGKAMLGASPFNERLRFGDERIEIRLPICHWNVPPNQALLKQERLSQIRTHASQQAVGLFDRSSARPDRDRCIATVERHAMEPVTPLRGVLAYHIGRKQSASIGHCASDQSRARALRRPLSDDALKIVMRGAGKKNGAGRIQVRGGAQMTGTTTEEKKDATEDLALWVSIVSLLIAAVAAAFAVYIWYVGRIEAKRLATIELSIKIVADPKTYELMNKTDEYLRGNGDEPHFAAAESWTIYLDYIAYLA